MQILVVLIPLGLLLLIAAIAAFIWAVRHDQFENLESEGMRILMDEDPAPPVPPRTPANRVSANPDPLPPGEDPEP